MLRQAVRLATRHRDAATNHIHQNAFLTSTPLTRPIICQWLWETPTIRSFSASSAQQGRSKQQRARRENIYIPLPQFPPTSNPELDQFLEGMRQDQFILDHMPEKFRRIVLKSSKHHLLQEQQKNKEDEDAVPHSIDIDGQTIDLKPIDEKITRSGADLSKAMDLMKTHSDYDVVIQLVEAMSYSKIEITEDQWTRCIRKLGLAGRPGLAKTIAWYARDCRNAFPLTRQTARELYRSNLARHYMPGNSYVHMVYERLETLRKLTDEKWILKNDPSIAGTELFITANIKKTFGAVDKGHNAKKYTEQFMRALERHKTAASYDFDKTEPYFHKISHARGTYKWYDAKITSVLCDKKRVSSTAKEREAGALARAAINDYEPLLYGLRLAMDLLTYPQNPEEAVAASEMLSTLNVIHKIKELNTKIKRWRKFLPSNSVVGMDAYMRAARELRGKYFLGEDGVSDEEKKARKYDFIADREPIPGSWYASSLETGRPRTAPSVA